jgi:chromosome partitioning protein
MKTLSLIAQKGGTGKTTLSIHLAVQANLAGLNVLLIDLDPQASATAWWRRRSAQTPALVQSQGETLSRILSTARDQHYDLVVIDTAPHNSQDASMCARVSDLVLIPSRPAILDLDAIGASTELLSQLGVKAEIVLNACPPPTRYGQPQIVTEARQALGIYGIPVSAATISQRAAFSHALIDGRAVVEYDRKGKAARELEQLWHGLRQELAL